MGQRVIEALGIGTSATHMEWFFGPKGLKFSEIGCRPPGVGAWDLYSAGNDLDLYREWANAIVHGTMSAQPSRQFSSGIVSLRPEGDGHITGYSGIAGDPGPAQRVGHRRPLPRPRYADPAARGRLLRQCVCPDAAPRLRRAPRDARRRRPDHHRARRVSPQITLLGPQPRVHLHRAFADLDADAVVATVTAGWQEREVDDAELREAVGRRTVNLALHARRLAGARGGPRVRPCRARARGCPGRAASALPRPARPRARVRRTTWPARSDAQTAAARSGADRLAGRRTAPGRAAPGTGGGVPAEVLRRLAPAGTTGAGPPSGGDPAAPRRDRPRWRSPAATSVSSPACCTSSTSRHTCRPAWWRGRPERWR